MSRATADLQQIQVLPRSFGHGTGRWGVSGTWSPVVFILGPCHDWSDLATDTTGLGKKWVFCSMSWKMYEDVWINEDTSNWRWKIYRELIRSWWIVPLFPVHVLRSFLNSPQLLKKRHSNNHGFQWICFTLQQHQHPQIPDSTKNQGSWSHFHQEAGSLLKGPLFEAPMKGGRWCHLEGLGAHMHIDSFRSMVKFYIVVWYATLGVLSFLASEENQKSEEYLLVSHNF